MKHPPCSYWRACYELATAPDSALAALIREYARAKTDKGGAHVCS